MNGVDLDPLLSPVGLVVILVGLRLMFGVVKAALKLLLVVGILIGLYSFFYGGTITG